MELDPVYVDRTIHRWQIFAKDEAIHAETGRFFSELAEAMTKKKTLSGGGYEVGYGKPPKHTRFKPGQSGNPKGRRKRSKNLRSVLREALFKTVTVIENGQLRTMTRMEAMVTGLVAKGLKGDIRATESVFRLANQHFPPGEEVEPMQIFLQRFTDGEILGELVPQADGARKFEPRKTKKAKSSEEDEPSGD